jgi:hypothetical protein
MLRFLKLCCEREPVVTASIAIGSIGARAAVRVFPACAARTPAGRLPGPGAPRCSQFPGTSHARARAGFLMPLLSPGRYREGTYLERLELYRAKHSH